MDDDENLSLEDMERLKAEAKAETDKLHAEMVTVFGGDPVTPTQIVLWKMNSMARFYANLFNQVICGTNEGEHFEEQVQRTLLALDAVTLRELGTMFSNMVAHHMELTAEAAKPKLHVVSHDISALNPNLRKN